MADQPKDIRCWACRTPCTPSFEKGKWWYSMACDHELAMAYDHGAWEAPPQIDITGEDAMRLMRERDEWLRGRSDS